MKKVLEELGEERVESKDKREFVRQKRQAQRQEEKMEECVIKAKAGEGRR